MSVGIVMLVHTALGRAEQVARHWAAAGCPVVIHVDAKVSDRRYKAFREALSDVALIRFSSRHVCTWGAWGIVAATQDACEMLLGDHAEVQHVFLSSGSCLPLRPVDELKTYLAARPRTDFIESATTADVPWTVGGLDEERFTLRFPFSWKTQRRAFDRYVEFQRKLGFRRRIPDGVVPHMGSQWWCLTRQTLQAILTDPQRAEYDRYFRKVWIPDESYFQTLARKHSTHVESRSLTLSKFDFQGKPHIFYDDHLQLLRRSDCFVARKIWPHANRLYRVFLTDAEGAMKRREPNPGKIDRIFSTASERRTRGRTGLYMQSRFPREGWEGGLTGARYSVFQGFTELFEDFEAWLSRTAGCRVHGQIFGPGDAEFSGGQQVINGALTAKAALRDHSPRTFLTNLIWNTRGERQCFQYSPRANQAVAWDMAKDGNAHVSVIAGAWAVPLFRTRRPFEEIRREAARLQRIEHEFLDALRSPWAKARAQIWSMAEVVEAPSEALQASIDEMGLRTARRLPELPEMRDLTGFGAFLQSLKNQGMHPYLMGDFPAEVDEPAQDEEPDDKPRRPYMVKK
ncbi:Core-2/I-Branching enzyme [Pseudooceanicola antarcticus]|uniref:Peptide O-xylosyltransferase n=1 Tax=Pseudooceanicola antarcticus TaxID=1247613 RepID=A0A285HRI1_9RHOB|nr:beta-1,6-N-acetylglucosaminyltransferase [Pseudooceanicola antarcticus]PJE27625.1 glycosyl transferase [Pseudooceanicola antarcticus]SNY38342.1 Core-2/I-Branching enzyme [Pseudooceanicola antarcticus]